MSQSSPVWRNDGHNDKEIARFVFEADDFVGEIVTESRDELRTLTSGELENFAAAISAAQESGDSGPLQRAVEAIYLRLRRDYDLTRKWEGFHSHWTSSLAAQLNAGLLPPRHFAEPQVSHGRSEVDVATDRLLGNGTALGLASASAGGVATLTAPVWSPPAPTLEMDAVFAAEFTVLVISIEAGPMLVGAIELVSPSNKARPAARRAFAMKCLNYLNAGIGLIIVDVVTERLANLHDEMAELIFGNAPRFPATPPIYAAAYRPFRQGDEDKVSVWPVTLSVGGPLPVLPLWLREVEQPVRVDLEAAYTETRQRSALG